MTALISHWGLIGVFVLMVPESACVPVPSEVTLMFSGFGVHQGWISLPLVIAAATAGNLVGSLLAYALGASRLLDRVPSLGRVLSRWEGLIDRHGMRGVLIARLLPLARTFVSLPAGARRVPLAPFIAMTVIGCALWAAVFALAGVLAAGAWSTVSSVLGRVLLAVGVLVLGASVRRRRVRHDQGDDELAGSRTG